MLFMPVSLAISKEISNDALYGEISINQDQSERRLKSGHDALSPVTQALSGYFEWKNRLEKNYGLSYTIEYSPQFQRDAQTTSINTGNDETNFIFHWAAVDHAEIKRGALIGWYQISRTLGGNTTSDFMSDIGIITPVNGGDTAPDKYRDLWQMLAWEQWFLDDSLRLGFGKLTTRTFLNLNRYAVSDRADFLTPQLVNNTVLPFTARNGMGLFAQYYMKQGYLTGMLREADGTSEDISFDTIGSGKWEYAVELGLTPENFLGSGEGIYRITGYYTDSIGSGLDQQPSGWGVAISLDQDFGKRIGAFARYTYADEDWRQFKQRFGMGMQYRHPFGFKHDRIGLAAWWAEATDDSLNDEAGVEAFWKLQLAPNFEVSPHIQLISNTQDTAENEPVVIGSFRLRVLL